MPLFDPNNTRSEELAVAVRIKSVMAANAIFKVLCESTDEVITASKIDIGAADEPEDGLEFSVDELANKFIYARIIRVDGTHVVKEAGFERPDESGQLQVFLRRFVRDSEDANDAFLFFWDCQSALVKSLQALVATADEMPNVRSFIEGPGPYLNSYKVAQAQGHYVWGTFNALWGDLIDE